MKNNFLIVSVLIGIFCSFSSCNAVKYVPENEHLLVKNTVIVDGKKNIDTEITDYIVQRPNQLVFGIPLPLHFYNVGNKDFVDDFEEWKEQRPKAYKSTVQLFSKKQAKGIRNFKANMHKWWLSNGEAPVIFDNRKTSETIINLGSHFFTEGYFDVKVRAEFDAISAKKGAVTYYVDKGEAYIINSINTFIDSDVLDSIYGVNTQNSFLNKGEIYTLRNEMNESDRIGKLFRNSGIYRFNKDAVVTELDSIGNSVDVNFYINDSINGIPYKIQTIKNINIFTDYTYNTKDDPILDSLTHEGYHFKAHSSLKYNPKHLLNSIFIEPGQIYKDDAREMTRRHLRALKNFRTVEIKYTELKDDSLEASIYLSPMKKYSIGINTELTHSNIRQLGISGKLSFLNRNIFKGAEILKFSVQGSFLDSKDAAQNDKLLNAWEVGADVSLELPRFLTPFSTDRIVPKSASPRTTITIGTSTQKNIGLDKQKFTGLIDYTWETSSTTNHSLEVINTQFIRNLNVDSYFNIYKSEFNALNTIKDAHFPNEDLNTTNVLSFIENNIDATFENANPREYQIAKNIESRYNIITEDVLVPSAAYTYTFNNSENYKDTDFSFFRARIVSSGNLATVVTRKTDENNVKTLFNTPIAQYIRTDFEYKKFWSLSLDNVLAFRSFLGIAMPYGNSSTIPFSRSFFIGGPNDLRAWKIYELGPGSSNNGLEYNVGSMKFITSLEYRFKILNSIKGAFFMDAGNIWDITNSALTNSNEKFKGLNSVKDIALGTGFGLRYDLSFILLRLDVGFKTYEPYLPNGERWFKNVNFKNNVYNFGISYPF